MKSPLLISCFLLLFLLSRAPGQDKAPGFDRTLDEVRKTLKEILTPAKEEKEDALRRLKAYRYLARVPYEDLELDEDYNQAAQAATKMCKELGRLDHTPKNPGWPEKEFKLAYRGASSSNLGAGYRNLSPALDGWMFDSDKFNIDRLGHRRWCVNPAMKKVGFGRTDEFTAMYSFDMSRKKVPDYDYVAFPAAGYMPAGFFSARHAWHISFHPAKYKAPDKEMKPSIYPLDAEDKKGEPLELDYVGTDALPFGIPNVLVFRPAKLDIKPGRRYLVEIDRVQRKGKGATKVSYIVEFAGK